MHRLDTSQDLEAAIAGLSATTPRFSAIVARHGLPSLRHVEPSLQSLLRIVTDQLISLRAGEAIWARLAARFGPFAPDLILAASQEELQSLGLSGAKARTFHAAALAFSQGSLSDANSLGDDEVEKRLTTIPGVGPWTASIYLLTALRSADAWPAADLALQVAAQDLFDLVDRPSSRRMKELGEAWRPFRSAAALLLWRHYRGLRGMSAL
jgi:DNA-3-methyladenine glycosylase II